MRFGIECVQAMRREVGGDFPIFFRIGDRDNRTGGTTLEDANEYARALEKAGVDVFDVSVSFFLRQGRIGRADLSKPRLGERSRWRPLSPSLRR